jgi:hypothetical protein
MRGEDNTEVLDLATVADPEAEIVSWCEFLTFFCVWQTESSSCSKGK